MISRNYKYYQPNKKDLKDKYGDCVNSLWCTQIRDLEDCIQFIIDREKFKEFDERFISFFENFFNSKCETVEWESGRKIYTFRVDNNTNDSWGVKWKFEKKNGSIRVSIYSKASADFWLDEFKVLFNYGIFKEDIKTLDAAIDYMKNVKGINILSTKDIYADRQFAYGKYSVEKDIDFAHEIESDDSYYYIMKLKSENYLSLIQTDKAINIKKLNRFLIEDGRISLDYLDDWFSA